MTEDVVDAWVRAGTVSGSAIGAMGAVTLTSWLGILGVCIALLTLLVNFWYKRQMLNIEREKMNREFPVDLDNK